MRRTRLVAAVLVAATLVLTGCGTHRVDPSASTPTLDGEIPPTPSANDYVSSVLNTKTRGSAKVTTTITIKTPEGQRTLVGKGPTFLDPGFGVIKWTADGATYVEMVNDQGIFVQSSPPDGRWTQYVDAKSTSATGGVATTTTSGSASPLRGLGVAQDVVNQGTEQVGKVSATRYTGRLPLTPKELRGMGLTEDEITALGEHWQGADENLTVWIDPDGFIVKVDRSIDLPNATGGPVSVTSSTTLRNLGVALDVTSPSTSLVDSASASPS